MGVDHYENFPVASWLCPAAIRPAVASLYRFARYADDLADEGDAPWEERLYALEALDDALSKAMTGQSDDLPPLLAELWPFVQSHQLDPHLLRDLLKAFCQDVRMTASGQRMQNMTQVLDYCSRSANPIGRLMLQLMDLAQSELLDMSDDICTALQLINFWQDLSVDLNRGRHYLPPEVTLPEAIAMTRQMMLKGAPLAWHIPGRMGWELRAVVHGGLRTLDLIEATNVMRTRPVLTTWDWLLVAWRCLSPKPPKL